MDKKVCPVYFYGILLSLALVATVPNWAQVVEEKTRVDTDLVLIDVLVMDEEGAVIEGWAYWVWTENEVPKGQVCAWTVEDPVRRTTRSVDQLTAK